MANAGPPHQAFAYVAHISAAGVRAITKLMQRYCHYAVCTVESLFNPIGVSIIDVYVHDSCVVPDQAAWVSAEATRGWVCWKRT